MAKRKVSRKTLKAKAWKMFSLYIRLKNSDKSGMSQCYTCDKIEHYSKLQCGHFIGGRSNAVLFNEEVVRSQCVHCNIFMRGNYQEYTVRMIDEVGRKKVDDLMRLKNVLVQIKISELKAILEKYSNLVNILSANSV